MSLLACACVANSVSIYGSFPKQGDPNMDNKNYSYCVSRARVCGTSWLDSSTCSSNPSPLIPNAPTTHQHRGNARGSKQSKLGDRGRHVSNIREFRAPLVVEIWIFSNHALLVLEGTPNASTFKIKTSQSGPCSSHVPQPPQSRSRNP